MKGFQPFIPNMFFLKLTAVFCFERFVRKKAPKFCFERFVRKQKLQNFVLNVLLVNKSPKILF